MFFQYCCVCTCVSEPTYVPHYVALLALVCRLHGELRSIANIARRRSIGGLLIVHPGTYAAARCRLLSATASASPTSAAPCGSIEDWVTGFNLLRNSRQALHLLLIQFAQNVVEVRVQRLQVAGAAAAAIFLFLTHLNAVATLSPPRGRNENYAPGQSS